jgi:ribonuclease Z
MTNLQTIFLTRLHMDTLGGLPGLIMTLADKSSASFDIVGPVGATHYLASSKAFLMRRQLKVAVAEVKHDATIVFQDSNILVKSFILVPDVISASKTKKRQKELSRLSSRKRLILNEMFSPDSASSKSFVTCEELSEIEDIEEGQQFDQTQAQTPSICYILKGPTLPGKFDINKAIELNIPKGSGRSKLVKGLSITLPSGETIEPHQVVGPRTDGSIIVILDVPSSNHIASFVENEALKNTCTNISNSPKLIYHFASKKTVEDKRYIAWIKSTNPSTQHVFLGKGFESQAQVFQASGQFLSILNGIDSEIFPKLDSCQLGTLPTVLLNENRFLVGKEIEEFQLAPKFKILPRIDTIQRLYPAKEYLPAVEKVKRQLKYVGSIEKYNEEFVVALGTGSCQPSRFRNVSGTFLYHPQGSILFDVGEGSLGQLTLVFGNELEKYLKSLKLLFISHLHGDHQLGAFSVIQAWYESNIESNNRLVVVAPQPFRQWMKDYSIVSDFGYSKCDFVDCNDVMEGQVNPKISEKLCKTANMKYFKTVAVNHCNLSFAGTAEYHDGFKVS